MCDGQAGSYRSVRRISTEKRAYVYEDRVTSRVVGNLPWDYFPLARHRDTIREQTSDKTSKSIRQQPSQGIVRPPIGPDRHRRKATCRVALLLGVKKSPSADSVGHRRNARNHHSALSLGSFAWLFRLVLVGARFTGKRKILSTRPLQHFPFSPPAKEWDQRANNDYQHGKQNQKK